MASSRKLIFGNPPFKLLVGHLAQDEDFLEDARRVIQLDQDACNRLAAQLSKADAFLDLPSLVTQATAVLGEGDDARKLASIIYRIGGMLHDADMSANEAIAELGKAFEEKVSAIEPNDRQKLIERLTALAVEPIGLAKQYKARRLVDATGSELDAVQIVCDIRPVFDETRERIEGAIPLIQLRLEYSSPDGESLVVEMRITEKQVDDMVDQLETAKRKLQLIRTLLANQSLPIPKTKSTLAEEE